MLNHSIRRFRLKRGLTQETLAHKAKIALPTLAKLESGANANPTLKTLQKIAKALRVTIDQLIR